MCKNIQNDILMQKKNAWNIHSGAEIIRDITIKGQFTRNFNHDKKKKENVCNMRERI